MTIFWSAEIATNFINIRDVVQKHDWIAAVTPTVLYIGKFGKIQNICRPRKDHSLETLK